ncbi:MAG: HAD hydrolase family protein [Candidatus Aquicultor sp.]|nr:HAD hydrolase family protein [Candidatus Aquicultor sp.]
MINLDIPGRGIYQLKSLVLDMNGTIAFDGIIPETVIGRLQKLSGGLEIYVITADTHGRLDSQRDKLPAGIQKVTPPGEGLQKAEFLENLGAETAVAIGNGANDVAMLKLAKLAIAVIGGEGCSAEVLEAADIITKSPEDALDLLLNTNRLIATLRM